MKIIEHVRGESHFIRYRNEMFVFRTADTGLEFTVPLDEVKGIELQATERSATLMRWIRKHIQVLLGGNAPTTTWDSPETPPAVGEA